MSDYRYGPNNGARGPPGAPAAFFGAGAPPAAMFPPRGPAFPHMQARPAGPLVVPPMAMLARGFVAPRPIVPPVMAIQQSSPALPPGWSEHFTPQGQRYYYNASTGVSTYELPSVADKAQPGAAVAAAPSSSTAPVTWIEYTDDASGQKYYYNTITKATTWDEPEEYRMQQARAEVQKMKSSTEASGVVVAEEQKRKDQKRRQADDEAIKMYEKMSKEDRVAAFKAFLEEKQVSSQFKWQEAQRFMSKEGYDSDPRWKFALATVGEKKQAFSEYCTQAEKKANIERRRQAKRVREEYLELLGNIEDKVVQNRITWDDLNDGAEFYGLRKDPRWQAIEAVKDKRDLFEGFVQDALRKKQQSDAKLAEEFKEKFMAKLREKSQDVVERASFTGKRRIDGELKKKIWLYFDEIEGAEDVRDVIPKHEVYDWTEQYLDVLKSEESQLWKAEREKKKKLEEVFTANLQNVVEEWLVLEKIGMNTSWKEVGEALTNACLPDQGEQPPTTLSERRQRRVFEKKMKRVRERMLPAVEIVQQMLVKAGFAVSSSSTIEDFSAAVKQGVLANLEANKPEEGEEEEEEPAPGEANPQAPTSSGVPKVDLLRELERAVEASNETIALPLFARHAFQLLQYQAMRSKGPTREHSRSPSPSRKRRRSSLDSPRRSRSPSQRRSRSRSRSHSSRRRLRSRSQSRDPRAALAIPSYGDLPTAGKSFHDDGVSPLRTPRAVTSAADEAAKAEEIIRQARLKLMAKQQAKLEGAADSEPEEGEEMEEGEVEE